MQVAVEEGGGGDGGETPGEAVEVVAVAGPELPHNNLLR